VCGPTVNSVFSGGRERGGYVAGARGVSCRIEVTADCSLPVSVIGINVAPVAGVSGECRRFVVVTKL